jgi:hypothetical protein
MGIAERVKPARRSLEVLRDAFNLDEAEVGEILERGGSALMDAYEALLAREEPAAAQRALIYAIVAAQRDAFGALTVTGAWRILSDVARPSTTQAFEVFDWFCRQPSGSILAVSAATLLVICRKAIL